MRLVGFNFVKINAERKNKVIDKIKVENNLDIKEITEAKTDFLNQKESLLNFKFLYELEYKPDFAKIKFEGNFIMSMESKVFKEIIKNWKKKEIESKTKLMLFNIVLKKCSLKALQIEENLNLPTHFRLPSLQLEPADKK